MKISNDTLSVLKNFSTINTGIAVDGDTLRTVSSQKNILAEANVSESFDTPFAIYDLNQFIATISLFENPDFEFGENSVVVSSGKNKSTYYYTDKTMIVTPPDKDLSPLLESAEISFKVSQAQIAEVLRAASILQAPEVAVVGNGGNITLTAYDSKNSTSNTFDVEVDAEATGTFNMIFRTENLKMISGDYQVEITSKGISRWTGSKVTYFITTESASTYVA
jgi:predicted P-loop ATPase/GTPase